MSLKVSELVWKHSTHKGSERLVLLAIARYVHDDGTNGWPSLIALAEDTQLAPRSVQYAISSLRQSGELIVTADAGPRGCNLYAVNIGRWRKDCVKNEPLLTQSTTPLNAKYNTFLTQPAAPDPLVKPLLTVKEKRETRARTSRQTSVPDNFSPSQEMLDKAMLKYPGMNILEATETWLGSMRANTEKYRYTNWNQAWWNGMAFAEGKGLHRKNGARNGQDKPTRMGRAIERMEQEYRAELEQVQGQRVRGTNAPNQAGYPRQLPQPPKRA